MQPGRQQTPPGQRRGGLQRRSDDPRRGPFALAVVHGLQLLRRRGDLEHPKVLPVPEQVRSVRQVEERHAAAACGASQETRRCPEEDQKCSQEGQQGDYQACWKVHRQTHPLVPWSTVRLRDCTNTTLRQLDRYLPQF